jgi:hypothetical protein
MEIRRSGRIAAILCSLCVALAVLIVHPVAESGVMDDASFTRTAQIFAATGHVVYNAWAAMPIGWQLIVGAIFIKLFGFSFTVVRLSTLPAAMGTVFLLHRIFVRCGMSERNATLATLSFALSPLFLLMSMTFMTDVSGVFALVLCLYACVRAVESESDRSAMLWVCFAIVSNALGGTVRQTSWLGLLVMVPSTLWLLRRRAGVLQIALPVLGLGVAFMGYALHWWNVHPYSIPESLLPEHVGAEELKTLVLTLWTGMLTFTMLFLPVLLAFAWSVRKCGRRVWMLVAGIAAVAAVVMFVAVERRHKPLFTMIRMPGTLLFRGEVRGLELVSHSYDATMLWLRLLLTVTAIGVIAAVVGVVMSRRSGASEEASSSISWPDLMVLLVPFSLVYGALLLPRSSGGQLFPRYLLPLVIVALILLVRFYQERVSARLPGVTIVAMAVLAVYGVADSHDFFAMTRARVAAMAEVRAAGVPDTAIDGGAEINMWTYTDRFGYFNDPKIRNPKGAYSPVEHIGNGNCRAEWHDLMPQLHSQYGLVFAPQDCAGPAGFAPIPYQTWLPPHGRQIYVVRYSDANIATPLPPS